MRETLLFEQNQNGQLRYRESRRDRGKSGNTEASGAAYFEDDKYQRTLAGFRCAPRVQSALDCLLAEDNR